jgi:hypothetical protein
LSVDSYDNYLLFFISTPSITLSLTARILERTSM